MDTPTPTKPRRLIRLAAVMNRVPFSTPHIYRLMAEREFPQSVAIGPNSRAWVEDEIDAWIETRILSRDMGTDDDERIISEHIGKGRQDLKAMKPLLRPGTDDDGEPGPAGTRAAGAKVQARTREKATA
jgi:prophage regulatory protein